jgi:multicomponent Na+:H+ antiporter subunit B
VTPRSLMLEVAGRTLYWVLLAASVWVLYRGHNLPGGGFIGGLVAVSATVVCAVSHSTELARRRLLFGDPSVLAASGVLASLLSGVVGWLVGRPFLTHPWFSIPLGVFSLDVSSVLVFDLGVYLAVWGAVGGYALHLLGLDPSSDEGGSA